MGTPTQEARRFDAVMAKTGLVVSLIALVSLIAPVPWQIRFAAVGIACLAGPGILGMRVALPGFDLMACIVLGFGLDVALLMVLGEIMVLAHAWLPSVSAFLLLVATAVASWALLARARQVSAKQLLAATADASRELLGRLRQERTDA